MGSSRLLSSRLLDLWGWLGWMCSIYGLCRAFCSSIGEGVSVKAPIILWCSDLVLWGWERQCGRFQDFGQCHIPWEALTSIFIWDGRFLVSFWCFYLVYLWKATLVCAIWLLGITQCDATFLYHNVNLCSSQLHAYIVYIIYKIRYW